MRERASMHRRYLRAKGLCARSTRGSPFTVGAVRKPSNVEPLGIAPYLQATKEEDVGVHGYVRAIVESQSAMRPCPTSINNVELVLPLLSLT